MRRWGAIVISLSAVCGLVGCQAGFDSQRSQLAGYADSGRYDLAANSLDQQETIAQYGEKNRLLYWLERGSVALAIGDSAKAIENLNKADDYMEVLRESNTGDDVGKWLLNDTAAPYYGASYENMYAGVVKLLANLAANRIDGGATVEARRLASKADSLRDKYERAIAQLKESPDYAAAQQALGERVKTTTDGQFVESSLGTYLTAITFMKSGESSLQDVAGRRLASTLELQRSLQPEVRAERFADVGGLRAGDVNLLAVAMSGPGPRKVAEKFGPIPIYTYTLYFEVPKFVRRAGRARGARVVVARLQSPTIATDAAAKPAGAEAIVTSAAPVAVVPGEIVATAELDLVEDLNAVAEENFRRELPAIYTRSIIRSSAKAAAWAVGTEAARRGTSNAESAQAAVEIIGIIGGLLFVSQTEKADLRTWLTLPGRAHVGTLKLEPGTYATRIEYLSGSGGGVLYAAPWKAMTVQPGARALTTFIEQWWE